MAKKNRRELPAEAAIETLAPWLNRTFFAAGICAWTGLVVVRNYQLAKPFLPDLIQFNEIIAATPKIFMGGMPARLMIVAAFWLVAVRIGREDDSSVRDKALKQPRTKLSRRGRRVRRHRPLSSRSRPCGTLASGVS